jgi:hypothetical protein
VTGDLEPSPRKVLHTFQVIHNENLWDRNSIIEDIYSLNKNLNVARHLFFSKKKPGSITEGTEKRLSQTSICTRRMLYFGNGKSGTITQGNTHTLQENYSK